MAKIPAFPCQELQKVRNTEDMIYCQTCKNTLSATPSFGPAMHCAPLRTPPFPPIGTRLDAWTTAGQSSGARVLVMSASPKSVLIFPLRAEATYRTLGNAFFEGRFSTLCRPRVVAHLACWSGGGPESPQKTQMPECCGRVEILARSVPP